LPGSNRSSSPPSRCVVAAVATAGVSVPSTSSSSSRSRWPIRRSTSRRTCADVNCTVVLELSRLGSSVLPLTLIPVKFSMANDSSMLEVSSSLERSTFRFVALLLASGRWSPESGRSADLRRAVLFFKVELLWRGKGRRGEFFCQRNEHRVRKKELDQKGNYILLAESLALLPELTIPSTMRLNPFPSSISCSRITSSSS